MANAKILIVEDERIVAKDIERSLKSLGYLVLATAASGREALEKAEATMPDLVLMDIQLKGDMDGIETAEQIQTQLDIPVIYLTAYADENTLQRAKITEPFGYILKPFDERDLYTTIEIALRRRLAETATRVALEKEKTLSEIKSRFWSMVAHEFRTPMTTILSASQLLESHGHQLSEGKRREYLYLIQTAVESMNDLLNDVLEVGRAEGGKLDFQPAPMNLEEFCRTLIEEMQFTTHSRHTIRFVLRGDCNHACLDRKLLRHILSNLLSNAIKYSPEGGSIDFELTCQAQEAIFQLKDQGIGIPPEDQAHLFESFHRATNVGGIPGTGLGLTLVKKCLELHRGRITIVSTVGRGTTVTVTLPLRSCIVTG